METKFPTIGSLVWRLALKWRTEVDRVVAPFGLTHAQYSALASLYSMYSRGLAPTQRELAQYTGLQQIFLSKLLKALAAEGFVARRQDELDARANRLALTDTGMKALNQAMPAVAALDRQITERLGDEAQALVKSLRLLLDQPQQEKIDE